MSFAKKADPEFNKALQEFQSQLTQLNEMLNKDFNLACFCEGDQVRVQGFVQQLVGQQYKEFFEMVNQMKDQVASGNKVEFELFYEDIEESGKKDFVFRLLNQFSLSFKIELDEQMKKVLSEAYSSYKNDLELPFLDMLRVLKYNCCIDLEVNETLKEDLKPFLALQYVFDFMTIEPVLEMEQGQILQKEKEIEKKIQETVLSLPSLIGDDLKVNISCGPALISVEFKGSLGTTLLSEFVICQYSRLVNNKRIYQPPPPKMKKLYLKILILGTTLVGKTQILRAFVGQEFQSISKKTIGADFESKKVTIQENEVTLQLWDTAGDERFQSLGFAFYRGADAFILTFDLTNQESFLDLDNKYSRLKENFSELNGVPIMVLGNKLDLCLENSYERKVSYDQAMEFAKERGFLYMEASAKSGTNIPEAFANLYNLIQDNHTNNSVNPF